jgi:hypothetical protein
MSRDPWSVVYAETGSDGFNARFHGVMRDLARDALAAIGDPLVALAVGGSYGMGRGRCQPSPGGAGSGIWSHGQAPAEAVELVVVANAQSKAIRRLLAPVSRKYSVMLNVDVDFTRVTDERGLARIRPGFEWYEFLSSHRLLFGQDEVFATARLRLGITDDGCTEPAFPADESRRLLMSAALGMATVAVGGVSCSDRRFFRLVRLIGMSLFLAGDGWVESPEDRDRAVLRRLGDGWFRDRAIEALDLHELYREAISFYSPSPADSISQDWRSLCQGWLLAADYLDAQEGVAFRPPFLAGRLSALARRCIGRLADGAPGQVAGRRNRLLRLLGSWYYRES